MIENLEALLALHRAGTMVAASTELKISQSAVSKRIAALERHYRRKLIQKKGRRVEFTHDGRRLVDKVNPMLSELRELFLDEQSSSRGELILGVSDAILSSWGAAVFYSIRQAMPEVTFHFHTYRTPVVLDRVRSGEFMAGVCTGSSDLDTDLQSEIVRLEPMVIIPSGLRPVGFSPDEGIEVISIEDYSGAWRSFRDHVRRLNITRRVALESFFSVGQMAIAGFGHGLVPIGVAKTLGVADDRLIDLGPSGLHRPVRFVARKSTYAIPNIARFFSLLEEQCQRLRAKPA